MCGQQKLISSWATARSDQIRCVYSPMLRAYILTTLGLSVWAIAARLNEFYAPFTDFNHIKMMQYTIVWLCAAESWPPAKKVKVKTSHIALWLQEVGARGQQCLWQSIWKAEPIPSLHCLILPRFKMAPSTAAISETFPVAFWSNPQSYYYNRASLFTWYCASEIN